jgi:hypothetical protein
MNEPRPAADHCSGTTSREDKMSKEAITKVVQRAISDAGFRRQLGTDPSGALRGFDLSADEAAALRAGDAGRLSALGVDQRMSKAFALGGAAAAATRPGGVDLNASGLNTGGANALSNADATGGAGSVRSALVSSSDANAAMIDDGATGARTIIPTEPGGNLTADVDGVAGMSNASVDDSSEAYLTKVGYDSSVAASKNADVSGGTAGEGTAFLDDSEAHLTSIDYDPNAATSAVTDAHDRGDGATTSAVTDAHDRGDVTRIDDDADSAGTGAASEQGPNLSS